MLILVLDRGQHPLSCWPYIFLLFFIFLKKRLKNLKNPNFYHLFINNGLFISQDKSLVISNSHLFYSYHIISSLFKQFGLVIEHKKTEVFHFSRSYRVFNPPPLNLTTLGGPIYYPKETWYYLGFIFDRKLTFQQHVNFYANKTISTVKYMKMLGNSSRRLISTQKHLLYRSCILSIILYNFQL